MGPRTRAQVPGTARIQASSSQSKLAGLALSGDESDLSDSNSEDDQPAKATNDGAKPLNNADQEAPVTRARTKQPVSDRSARLILQATRGSREGAPADEVDEDGDDDVGDDDEESFESDDVSDEITVGGDLPSQQWDRTRADIVMDRIKYMDQRELAEELVKYILAHPDEATSIMFKRPDVSRPILECIAMRSKVFEATLIDVKGSTSIHDVDVAASSRDVDTTVLRHNNKSHLIHSQRESNEGEERMKGVTKRKRMSSSSSSTGFTSSQRQRDTRTQASHMESEEGASRTLSSICTNAQSKALSCPSSSADASQAVSDTQNAMKVVNSSSSSLGLMKSNDKVCGEVAPKGDVSQPCLKANEAVKGGISQSLQSSSSSLSLSTLSSTTCKRPELEAVEEGASHSSHSSSQLSSSAPCHTPRARTKKVAAESFSSPWQKLVVFFQQKSLQEEGPQESLQGDEREKPLQGHIFQPGPKGTPHSLKKRNRAESTTNSEKQQQQQQQQEQQVQQKKRNKMSSQVIDLISSDQGSESQSSTKKIKEMEVIILC